MKEEQGGETKRWKNDVEYSKNKNFASLPWLIFFFFLFVLTTPYHGSGRVHIPRESTFPVVQQHCDACSDCNYATT
jgi:hypothetical protein